MDALIDILKQELKTSCKFLTLLGDEHKYLLIGDTGGCGGIDSELDRLLDQAQKLEITRLQIVGGLSEKFGVHKDRVIPDLAPRLQTKLTHKLGLLRQSIIDARRDVEERRKRNRALIERSQELISESNEVLTRNLTLVCGKPDPPVRGVAGSSLVTQSG